MKTLFLVIATWLSFTGITQEIAEWSIGSSPFKLEKNFQSFHSKMEPKAFLNAYSHSEKKPRFTSIYMIEFGYNIINDRMKNCFDCYEGKLKMTEFGLMIGKRINFNLEKEAKWRVFFEGDLNYRWMQVKGNYTGGQSGAIQKDERFHSTGTSIRFGTRFKPFDKFSIEPSFCFNQDFGYYESIVYDYSEFFITFYGGGFDLRLMYHL